MATPILHAWPSSPYSAKALAYLRHKGVVFDASVPSLWTLQRRIRGAIGVALLPTMEGVDGQWLQDSAVIIDTFEDKVSERAVYPSHPTQRLASELLALYADEWLPMAALHYRWNVPENAAFAIEDFGRCGLPWLPRRLRRPIARRVAARMRAYRPKLGITPETHAGIERSTEILIAALEQTLQHHDYVLGGRPCLGDFALYGPLAAHLWRDPGTTYLFDDAPHVVAWMERLRHSPGAVGAWLDEGEIPSTLAPVWRLIFEDQWPYLQDVCAAMATWSAANATATRVPRALGDTTFTIGGCSGTRRLMTFSAWKLQRVVTSLEDAGAAGSRWLESVGGQAVAKTVPSPWQGRSQHRLVLADKDRA